ncbi:hypothetical protein [Allobaculum mucilyticum]|uniref:hypothetical protein n=2 Tax=Allobaculum mucilyticum TaxID=2834459 RepID=UPI001E33BE16|nr:hypothetical protein [Allobaculum mucilyticum]
MVQRMKKITTGFITTAFGILTVFHTPVYGQEQFDAPIPEIEAFDLVEYVTVGESGTYKSSVEEWCKEKVEYSLAIGSSDNSVLQVNENNEFIAVKEGKVLLIWSYTLSEETTDRLHRKWPNVDFSLPEEVICQTVYVTNNKPVYRLYHPGSGEHLLTTDKNEYRLLYKNGWKAEQSRWLSDQSDTAKLDVHRLYNPNASDHHYTADMQEIAYLLSAGWKDEGVAFHSGTLGGQAVPVYRLYNPNAITGSHHFTASLEECKALQRAGWIFEGIGFNVLPLRTDQADLGITGPEAE